MTLPSNLIHHRCCSCH